MRQRTNKRELNKQGVEGLLVSIIGAAGASGATITAIEAAAKYDRHTVVKYLLVLEQKEIVSCRIVGKAKIWALNTAPLSAVFSGLVAPKSFIEQVLSTVMLSVPQGLVIVDSSYKIIYANEVAKQLNRQAQYVYELFGLENPVRLTKLVYLLDNVTTNKLASRQTLLTPQQKLYSLSLQSFSKGNQKAAVILIDDITEAKATQQLIADQKAMLVAERRALNEAAIVAETDTRGIITYVNDKFCEISGYSAKELIGKTHIIVNSGHHPKSFWSSMWKTIVSGRVWQGEIKNKRKNGQFYWVDSVIAPVLDEKHKPIKYIAIRYDITKYKEPTLLNNGTKRR